MLPIILFSVLFFGTPSSTLPLERQPYAAGCTINVVTLSPEPVVVDANTLQFLYPEPKQKTISLSIGSSEIIACPGSNFALGATSVTSTQATCVTGTTFIASANQSLNFNEVKCAKEAFHTARYTQKACENKGKEIEVGFILNDKTFARVITICFDTENLTPFYSTYDLTRSIGAHESGIERISFIEDNFYGLDKKVNDLYVRGGQKTTINTLLGLPANSTQYIKDTGDFYLARGHLTAKADFVYAHQQLATFHYVNVAPQWQTFNGMNWETVEATVRNYADTHTLDLKVYTGVYGVSTLPHAQTGLETPLYLYVEGAKKALPVPLLYWKVAYDPKSEKGVAFLGVNNPYMKELTKAMICENILTQVSWMAIHNNTVSEGYIYACSVPDLRKTITVLPDFNVQSVLL